MVLMDDQGHRIHATIRKTLVYKFHSELQEGCVYSLQFLSVVANVGAFRTTRHDFKLVFQFSTRVKLMETGRVAGDGYDFVPFPQIFGGGFNLDFLVDVLGLLTGIGREKDYERNGTKTKFNVIALEADGHKIECTLFGSFVDELNTYLASGDVENTMVIVQFAKVKEFQEKIHLQNCIGCTKLIFNPTCEVAVKLKNRMMESMESPSQGLSQLSESSKVSMEQEFLELTPRNTIRGLNDSKQESIYVVLATVKHISNEDDWWYTACVCNKAVYPDCKMFFCEKCYKHVVKVDLRYRIKVCVFDATGNAIFVIFYRDARSLFNKSCADMFENEDKASGNHAIPNDIFNLVDKEFLFKIEYKKHLNTQFEQSFTIKKICSDALIIKKFKEMSGHIADVDGSFDSSYIGHGKQMTIGSSSNAVAQDLMSKFSCDVIENENDPKVNEKEACDLSKKSMELSPMSKVVATDEEGIGLSNISEVVTPPVNNVSAVVRVLDPSMESQGFTPLPTFSASHDPVDLSKDSEELTPLKRESPTEMGNIDLHVPLMLLKKKIKIEKE